LAIDTPTPLAGHYDISCFSLLPPFSAIIFISRFHAISLPYFIIRSYAIFISPAFSADVSISSHFSHIIAFVAASCLAFAEGQSFAFQLPQLSPDSWLCLCFLLMSDSRATPGLADKDYQLSAFTPISFSQPHFTLHTLLSLAADIAAD
jgi:hypothetical protein